MELLIQNVTIVDGSGQKGYLGNVGVHEGRILLDPKEGLAERIIDGTGKVLCPGFIDSHSHGDLTCGKDFQNLSKTSQGITTEVAGNCGITLAPVSEKYLELTRRSGEYGELPKMANWTKFANYMQYLEEQPKTLNTAMLVGHSAIRTAVMGYEERRATEQELLRMQGYLQEALEAGAFGMSTGLVYIPGAYSDTEELIALAQVLHRYDASFMSHMRNESFDVVKSVEEILRIGREAEVPVFISHHKALGRSNWGAVKKTLELMRKASAEGVRVTCDQYPYSRNMTGVRVCIPPEYFAGNLEETVSLLKQPAMRQEIRLKMQDPGYQYDNYYLNAGGWDGILLCTSPNVPQAVGKTIAEYAALIGQDPFEAYFDLLIRNQCMGHAVFNSMCDEDVLEIASFEHTIVGTDGDIFSADGVTHPRVFGTFPRAICYFVKEKRIMSLEDIIHKMTGLTAQRHRIPNKGLIAEGYDGDLVIFDYDRLKDRATYTNSNVVADGIEQVIVGGVVVYEDQELTGKYPGKIIKASGFERNKSL